MKLQLLLTGNELMSGHTVDSNSAMIAEFLEQSGFTIHRKVTIGDELDELINEMRELSQDTDVLIVNGGLGPTIDDLTAEALANLTGNPLIENPTARRHIEQWCQRRNAQLNKSNLKQAILPEGIEILPNPIGSAVGFSIEHNDCLIICTPGVPSELRAMMKDSIVNMIQQRHPDANPPDTIRLQTFGLGESGLQELVRKRCPDWPEQVTLGFRAGLPLLEIKLSITNPAHKDLQQQCLGKLQELMGDYIIGEQSITLAQKLITLLAEQNRTITTVESCTGGLMASMLTETPGASTAFEAGFVTYSNAMKTKMVGVSPELLQQHGAVSEPVVLAMAQGALERTEADYAVAVSGIAGPDGGSEEKPVGTVWIAWGNSTQLQAQQAQINMPRKWFQQLVAALGLDLIRRELLGITDLPRYFRKKS